MNTRPFLITTLVLFALSAPLVSSATTTPTVLAGVPKSPLWFSQDPFFAGETVTIYSVVYNSTPYDFSGSLEMKDGTTPVGRKDFTIKAGEGAQVVSFSWRATQGNHTLHAEIVDKNFLSSDQSAFAANVPTLGTGDVKRFADVDTDGDRIGDTLDTDDDGDGLSDVAERKLGTSSTIADTDLDGIPDGKDPHPLKKDELPPAPPPPPPVVEKKVPNFIEKKILDIMPAPIVRTALPIMSNIDEIRTDAASSSTNHAERVARSLPPPSQVNASTSTGASWGRMVAGVNDGELVRSPFQYAKLFFFLILKFFTANIFAFYILCLLIIYKIVKTVIGLFL